MCTVEMQWLSNVMITYIETETALQHTSAMSNNMFAPSLLVSSAYLCLLFPHAVNAGGQLDGVEGVGVVGRGVRDVGDHGGSAVDVPQGLPEQHCQLAVPGLVVHTV